MDGTHATVVPVQRQSLPPTDRSSYGAECLASGYREGARTNQRKESVLQGCAGRDPQRDLGTVPPGNRASASCWETRRYSLPIRAMGGVPSAEHGAHRRMSRAPKWPAALGRVSQQDVV